MHYSGEVGNVYMILWQIYSGNYYTKFHQNRPTFVGDITKKTFWSLFPDTLYVGRDEYTSDALTGLLSSWSGAS